MVAEWGPTVWSLWQRNLGRAILYFWRERVGNGDSKAHRLYSQELADPLLKWFGSEPRHAWRLSGTVVKALALEPDSSSSLLAV